MEMAARVVVQRTHDRKLVGVLSLQWKQLGDVHARNVRRDRIPNATVLRRSLRLHVVRVQVTRTTVKPDQDRRVVVAAARRLLGSSHIAQTGRRHPRNTQLHKTAT